jgi:hypothetical protein
MSRRECPGFHARNTISSRRWPKGRYSLPAFPQTHPWATTILIDKNDTGGLECAVNCCDVGGMYPRAFLKALDDPFRNLNRGLFEIGS